MRKNKLLNVLLSYYLAFFYFTSQAPAADNQPNLAEQDQTSVVILAYSRIGDDFDTDSSLQTTQFLKHLKTLQKQDANIISLNQVVNSFNVAKPLQQKAVAITFEGAYKSAFKNAVPLLLKNNIPFTIFYAADKANSNSPEFMSLQDLINLKQNNKELVTLGVLPPPYISLLGLSKLEIQSQLNKAKASHREVFKEEPLFFSYPYGEYDNTIKNLVQEQSYSAALSLNSGAAYQGSARFALPRFAITDEYGDEDHFNMIISSLPLPASELQPQSPRISTTTPNIGFTLAQELEKSKKDIHCFASNQSNPIIEFLGKSRVELRLKTPINDKRTRINCILPVTSGAPEDTKINNWRWLGFLLINPAL